MGHDQPPATSMNVDVGALEQFAKTLTGEAAAIGKLDSGLGAAVGALPGTGWDATCQQTETSVTNALKRIAGRVTAIADSIDRAGKVVAMTDQAFADDLNKIGVQA
jgi:hypothetical protein